MNIVILLFLSVEFTKSVKVYYFANQDSKSQSSEYEKLQKNPQDNQIRTFLKLLSKGFQDESPLSGIQNKQPNNLKKVYDYDYDAYYRVESPKKNENFNECEGDHCVLLLPGKPPYLVDNPSKDKNHLADRGRLKTRSNSETKIVNSKLGKNLKSKSLKKTKFTTKNKVGSNFKSRSLDKDETNYKSNYAHTDDSHYKSNSVHTDDSYSYLNSVDCSNYKSNSEPENGFFYSSDSQEKDYLQSNSNSEHKDDSSYNSDSQDNHVDEGKFTSRKNNGSKINTTSLENCSSESRSCSECVTKKPKMKLKKPKMKKKKVKKPIWEKTSDEITSDDLKDIHITWPYDVHGKWPNADMVPKSVTRKLTDVEPGYKDRTLEDTYHIKKGISRTKNKNGEDSRKFSNDYLDINDLFRSAKVKDSNGNFTLYLRKPVGRSKFPSVLFREHNKPTIYHKNKLFNDGAIGIARKFYKKQTNYTKTSKSKSETTTKKESSESKSSDSNSYEVTTARQVIKKEFKKPHKKPKESSDSVASDSVEKVETKKDSSTKSESEEKPKPAQRKNKVTKKKPKRFAIVDSLNSYVPDTTKETVDAEDTSKETIEQPSSEEKEVITKRPFKKSKVKIPGKPEVYVQAGKFYKEGKDFRKRLPHFMPKRYHWDPDEHNKLGAFWFNGPQGRDGPGIWKIAY